MRPVRTLGICATVRGGALELLLCFNLDSCFNIKHEQVEEMMGRPRKIRWAASAYLAFITLAQVQHYFVHTVDLKWVTEHGPWIEKANNTWNRKKSH
jgi:endo-alpha-1,4-polygalactosaminidase (GH114 family)